MRFKGKYSTSDVAGLFKQKEAGDWYVLTQMEPLYARRAFPCFDEPRFRASWYIVLTVPEHQRAFANMPVETERRRSRVCHFPRSRRVLSAFLWAAQAVKPRFDPNR